MRGVACCCENKGRAHASITKTRTAEGAPAAGGRANALALTESLYRCFLGNAPRGGWVDRLGEDGTRLGDFMPATSLYHLVGSVDELSEFCAGDKSSGASP